MPSIQDIIEIEQLLAAYGHLIDERQWSRLGEVFHPDIEFDATRASGGVTYGLDALRAHWAAPEHQRIHPLAHHATNIWVLDETADGAINVLSKGIGVGVRGRVGSVTYRDRFVRTEEGLRLFRREADYRTLEGIPDPG